MTDKELLMLAHEMIYKAYAPYSSFAVGAALECVDDTIFTGCNIENAAFSETICAERVAVFKAISEGKRDFARIAIVAESDSYCLPCGSCRQVLAEFSPEMEVLCAKGNGSYVSYKLRDLLPLAFKLDKGDLHKTENPPTDK